MALGCSQEYFDFSEVAHSALVMYFTQGGVVVLGRRGFLGIYKTKCGSVRVLNYSINRASEEFPFIVTLSFLVTENRIFIGCYFKLVVFNFFFLFIKIKNFYLNNFSL